MAEPPFRTIADDLQGKILAGRWRAGEALPSRRDLAEHYHVTPNTINRAIAALADAGLVTANDRQGTYVSDIPLATSEHAPSVARRGRFRVALIAATDDTVSDGSRDTWTITALRQLERSIGAAGGSTSFYRVYFAGENSGGDRFTSPGAAIKAALGHAVDAVAVLNLSNFAGWDDAIPMALDPERLPCICVTGVAMPAPFPQVSYDQFHAGYTAARHLLDAGYARVAFLRPCTAAWIEARIAGARAAVRHAGRDDSAFTLIEDSAPESYDRFRERGETGRSTRCSDLARRLEANGQTGLIVHADQDALSVLADLRARGVQPGAQLGLIGFDDHAGSLAAGLSTVRPPLEAMGERAAAHLIAALTGPQDVRQYCLAPVLTRRASTERGTLPS